MSEEVTLDEFADSLDTGDSQERVSSRFWGEIPEDWRLVSGSDVYEVNPNPKPEEEPNTYIEMDALDTELPWPKYFGTRDASEYSGKTFTKGDTLFARITPCTENGKAAIVPEMETEVGIGSTEYAVLSPKRDSINPWLLYYLGKSYPVHNYAVSRMRGSTGRQRVPFSVFRRELDIALPPLSEQRKIATVLYTIDRAIEKTEKVIEQVRTVKQGILQDLMNGAGSDRPLEDKRVGPRVVSLPKDWEVVQIGDALEREIILEQQDGNHGSDYPRKDEFVDEGVPYLSAEMLSEGEVDFSQAKFLTEERANQLRIGFAKDGDVLLAHNATVGPAGLLETNLDFVIIGTSLTYYRCNPDKLDSQYLTYFFQSGTFQKQLQDVMRQSTRNQVPITRQRNLHLILPPIQQQREISNQIDTVNEKLRTENQYQERLQRLKRGLMQDLLSGTVRTTDTNIEVPEEVAKYG